MNHVMEIFRSGRRPIRSYADMENKLTANESLRLYKNLKQLALKSEIREGYLKSIYRTEASLTKKALQEKILSEESI